jgi:hypothetical protein
MLHFVFAAFSGAGLADISAQLAKPVRELVRMLVGAGHPSRRHAADICAITVQFDASGHRTHVLFM